MLFRHRVACAALAAAFCLLPLASVQAQEGPPPEVRAAIQSIVRMLQATDSASLGAFAREHLAPAYRASMGDGELMAHLERLRRATGGRVDDVSVEKSDGGLTLRLSGAHEVAIDVALDDQHRITRLALRDVSANRASGAASAWSGLTWENLGEHLHAWEAKGFNGVVLARHAGREVVRAAYGFADPAAGRRSVLTTIYGIGSTPIDFTVTGILLLGERGQVALDDSIGKYLPDVPADKRAITLRQLMTGKSGLPDFHDRPGVDWDPDLAWIDRPTAERRILAAPLLFMPGTGEAHSHSAFGLLAAIIERVSGRSYPDFVRAEILDPLGMTRTGFYGTRGTFDVADFAVGSGPSLVGLPNIPPNWGPTSWLVMGSGGMFSTLNDMARYYQAIDDDRLLHGEWARWQQGETVGLGGSDRGFFIFHVSNGHGDRVLGLMNGEGRSPEVRAMLDAVERVVFRT